MRVCILKVEDSIVQERYFKSNFRPWLHRFPDQYYYHFRTCAASSI